MNDEQKQALTMKLVEFLILEMPKEGLNDKDFRECMQGLMYCLYVQIRENLGARVGMMALGELLQVCAEEAPDCGVHVDLIPVPINPGKRH